MDINKNVNKVSIDGNEACAYIAYAFSEMAAIYPITPSSPIGEHIDQWASMGKKNLFNMPVKVVEMQSEAGAIAAVHGALQMGVLTSTYTASQGLLLMIPNMYKISGQGLPCVIHVASRSIAAHSLSIFGDHQDVMAIRQTGFAILSTSSVQEVMDLAGIAHLTAIKTRVPFLHFFDGFRTSHEVNTIKKLDYDILKELIDYKSLEKFRKNGLSPNRPITRGTAQSDDIYFQAKIASNQKYYSVEDSVNEYMQKLNEKINTDYKPFNYYGHAEAENIIVAMGSVCQTVKKTVDYLNSKGKKTGLITVHLFRPFSEKYFFNVVPKTVKNIAVLDRTIEHGSISEPLKQDIISIYYNKENRPNIIGGIYGLSSKDTKLTDIEAVFINLETERKDHFTIGINDDVTNTSLENTKNEELLNTDIKEVLLYGLGSDGTVGASKNIVKIIGDNTNLYSQAYASYDSKKAGSITRMHLRFSKDKIESPYLVDNPNFISCSTDSYLFKYDMLKGLRKNGVFLLNTSVEKEHIPNFLPEMVKKQLADKQAKLFIINAKDIAYELGLGRRINTLMQSAFFKLNQDLLDFEKAKEMMKEYATKTYAKKGKDVLEMNYQAIDLGGEKIEEIFVDPSWKNLDKKEEVVEKNLPSFVQNLATIINKIEGDSLPVSAFMDYEDGHMDNGSTKYEKRAIANYIPSWNPETCIQCNQCVFSCPHAVIRSFLMTKEEHENAPTNIKYSPLKGRNPNDYRFTIQISALDCTECGICVEVCPTKEKSLKMQDIKKELDLGAQEFADYTFEKVEYKDLGDSNYKDVNFRRPLFEFHGACAGCGETQYIKALTQLFGDRMVIANATGCTSIYGGSFPSTPFTKDEKGQGPAWANSLFEDNAEFGFGMQIGSTTLRSKLYNLVYKNIDIFPLDLKDLLNEWIINYENGKESRKISDKIFILLDKYKDEYKDNFIFNEILVLKDFFVKVSQWIIGGDGWAYDIGFGGIDHAISNNENINILVVDTEVYSNTGGQSSKAAQFGSIAKFTTSGKKTNKKDLAQIAMSYGNVYVAQVSHGANPNQMIKAMKEAEEFDGPSIILAYSPCIEHGIKGGLTNTMRQAKTATECGYWPIFRYDPRKEEEGKNPFQLDAPKKPKWEIYEEHLLSENRYNNLKRINPERADEILKSNKAFAMKRYRMYKRFEAMDYSIEE